MAAFYNDEFDVIEEFITKYALTGSGAQLDETRYDPRIEPKWNNFRVRDLKNVK